MKKTIIFCIVVLLLISPLYAAEKAAETKAPAKTMKAETPPDRGGVDWETWGTDVEVNGWVEWKYGYEFRDKNHFRMDVGLNLPYRISYFTLNYFDTTLNGDNNFDTESYHFEHDIWWNPIESLPIDTAVQVWMNSGVHDQLRLGVRWRISDTSIIKDFFDFAHLYLTTQIHPLQTDFVSSPGWGMSFEHFWIWTVFPEFLGKDRLYMIGFIDHNMNFGGGASNNHDVILENGLKLRTIGKLYVVGDILYNDYNVGEEWGSRLSLMYNLPF